MRNKNFIVSFILFLSMVVILASCGLQQDKVEKIIEDGVEVVLNGIEPYKIKGMPSNLHLEKEYIIDFESNDLSGLGISDITGFDVDSDGNVYLGS